MSGNSLSSQPREDRRWLAAGAFGGMTGGGCAQNKDGKTALEVARERKGDRTETGDMKQTISVLLPGDKGKGGSCAIS